MLLFMTGFAGRERASLTGHVVIINGLRFSYDSVLT